MHNKFNSRRKKSKREMIFNRDGGKCYYCSKKLQIDRPDHKKSYATIEHKIRLTDGGTWHEDNLAIACKKCNNMLGYVMQQVTDGIEKIVITEYRPEIIKTKEVLRYVDFKIKRIIKKRYGKLGHTVNPDKKFSYEINVDSKI